MKRLLATTFLLTTLSGCMWRHVADTTVNYKEVDYPAQIYERKAREGYEREIRSPIGIGTDFEADGVIDFATGISIRCPEDIPILEDSFEEGLEKAGYGMSEETRRRYDDSAHWFYRSDFIILEKDN